MSPKLRSLLARVVLLGGAAFVGTYLSKSAPHDQVVAVRLSGREVERIQGVVTRVGDDEPTAGFSQSFSAASPAPHLVRHPFSAPNGTYIVVISWSERVDSSASPAQAAESSGAEALRPKLIETTFERRVSLAGGEVIVSPD
ncbi:MAG: hypothetical protein EOO73_31475 [Myxococcales bacterium]|nr:MAG: hypothetical protein EOO73_31475 [Myxococcales bacterium]